MPPIPADGFRSDEEIARVPGGRRIEGRLIKLGPPPDIYAFYRGATQRNFYRIPISVSPGLSARQGTEAVRSIPEKQQGVVVVRLVGNGHAGPKSCEQPDPVGYPA